MNTTSANPAGNSVATPQATSVFRNILVATDFSAASKRALIDAQNLAAEHGAHLSLVNVVQSDWRYEMLESPPEMACEEADAKQRLESATSEIGPGHAVDSILLKHGETVAGVLSAIQETSADLLVMGTRGRNGLRKLALGSVAEQLLRVAPCAVITVGPRMDFSKFPECKPRNILFATDFGKSSVKALPLAVELARHHGAKLLVQHMIPPMPAGSSGLSAYAPANEAAEDVIGFEHSARKRAIEQLKEFLPPNLLDPPPEYLVGTDFLAEGILTAAVKFNVDLIIMGAVRKGSAQVAAHIPWTAVHQVVRDAPCHVMTVAA